MMAAYAAAKAGHEVLLLEKNEKLGKKLYITGKGRCNFTNLCQPEEFLEKVMRNPRFLYSSITRFPPQAMMDFLAENGCPVKTERGRRAFPKSDKASDVTAALTKAMKRAGVKVRLGARVKEILFTDTEDYITNLHNSEVTTDEIDIKSLHNKTDSYEYEISADNKHNIKTEVDKHQVDSNNLCKLDKSESIIQDYICNSNVFDNHRVNINNLHNIKVAGIKLSDGKFIPADHVIIATGGLSYPSTGSTGDGFRFAKKMGLHVLPQRPSLVSLNIQEGWVKKLQGLTLKNVKLTAGGFSGQGELLFTHFGISGPLVLSASACLPEDFPFEGDDHPSGKPMEVFLDLKPALSSEQIDRRLSREFLLSKNKELKNILPVLMPKALVSPFISLCGISPEKKANSITKEERERIGKFLKELPMKALSTRGFSEAVVTRGGVDIKEIDPKTMKVKKAEGLSICGEALDLDAMTGGYNLQIAWSTGYIAGSSV